MNHPHVIRRTRKNDLPPPPAVLVNAIQKLGRWVGLRGEVMATFARLGAVDDGWRDGARRYGAA